jgi:Tol biopolymer transport system component
MFSTRLVAAILFVAPLASAQDAVMKIGDVFTGSIDTAFDTDVVHFPGMAGMLLTTTAKGSKGFHPTLTLTDLSSGQPVDLTGFLVGVGGAKATIKKLPLPTTGDYELTIGPADASLGGYKLTTKGVVTKSLKSFKDGSSTEPGTGEVDFAAMPGTKLTAKVKPAKGFESVPGVPLLTGPDGPIDLTSFTTLTSGKVPTAKVAPVELPVMGDYTFTVVAQTDGDVPPLFTSLKLSFAKVKKTIYVETTSFQNIDTQLLSLATSGQQAAAGSYDAVTTLNGHKVAFLSFATNLVPGCGGGAAFPAAQNYDVFVRDTDAGTTVSASAPTGSSDGVGSGTGTAGPDTCTNPSIDSLGTIVAFDTGASGLVGGDSNGKQDVFVRELETETTTRVSVTSLGAEAHGDSTDPSLSGDGRFVAFVSTAADLVTDDGNGTPDIFLHDRQLGTTVRISLAPGGGEIHGDSSEPAISRDGTHVAFSTTAADILPGDGNGKKDIYVVTLATGAVARATLTDGGAEVNADATAPSISADGRFVAFYSVGHFAAGDSTASTDIFVKDMVTGSVDLVSVSSSGAQANNNSQLPKLSDNGQQVLFRSLANNLVPGGDVNGPLNGDVYLRDRGAATTIKVSVSYLGEGGNGDAYPGDISGDGTHAIFFGSDTNLVQLQDKNNDWDVWVRF